MSALADKVTSKNLAEDDRTSGGSTWLDQIDAILKKSPQNRNHAQNSYLKKLLNIKYFQQLIKCSDFQIIKHVLRNSKIVRPRKRQIIFRKNDPKDCFYVILKGKIGIEQDLYEAEKIVDQHKIATMIKTLLSHLQQFEAKSPRKRFRKSDKQEFYGIPNHEPGDFKLHELPLSQIQFVDEIGQEQSIGDQITNLHSRRKYNAIAMQDCILLEISYSNFLKAIKYYNEKKLQIKHTFFRKFKCFDLFEDDQLKSFIQQCKSDQRGKNQFVFKEHEPATSFYLLYEGQICIIKTAQLFVENPNKLYANRKTYLQNKKNSEQLPYANLEKLYNYRPKEEKIELGILDKNNIFGEEQAFLRTPRQTDAKVCSNIARYYVVVIKDLEVALKQKKYLLVDFKDFLFANITRKKIMYRQEKFSEVLNLRNKNQLDYFYIDENKQDVQSPMKYKLQKINRRVLELSKNLQKQSSTEAEDKPFYNTFNFTKLLDRKQDVIVDDPQTADEKKLLHLTHTTRYIDKQLNSQTKFNETNSRSKYKITLNEPLFEPTYFDDLNKQYRKMEQESRKMRFSFKVEKSSEKKPRPKSSIIKRPLM